MTDLFIFVEGIDDEQFIENIIDDSLTKICERYKIIMYQSKKKDYVNNYIKSIKSMPYGDYIFLADQDGNARKKEELLNKFKELEENKIMFTIYEIESWIIAGVTRTHLNNLKINKNYDNTELVTKEIFESIIPHGFSKLQFIFYIYKIYNVIEARNNNNSFNMFYDYLSKINAS